MSQLKWHQIQINLNCDRSYENHCQWNLKSCFREHLHCVAKVSVCYGCIHVILFGNDLWFWGTNLDPSKLFHAVAARTVIVHYYACCLTCMLHIVRLETSKDNLAFEKTPFSHYNPGWLSNLIIFVLFLYKTY